MPTVIVTARRRPHEEFLLGYGCLAGLLYLTGAVPMPRMVADLPTPAQYLWAAALAVSGVGLVGCWARGVWALQLELGGLLMAAGALVLLATTGVIAGLVAGAGWLTLVSSGLVVAWAAAHLDRARQITNDLRRIRKG